MSVKITTSGDFRNIRAFGERMAKKTYLRQLSKYGPMGVAALKSASPEDTGTMSQGWYYQVVDKPGYFAIHWLNSDLEGKGIRFPVAILVQYGHATRNGALVQGRDFINPAMRVIFDNMASDMWREVTR